MREDLTMNLLRNRSLIVAVFSGMLLLTGVGCASARQEAVHNSLDELEKEIAADEKADEAEEK